MKREYSKCGILAKNCGFLSISGRPVAENILSAMFLGLAEYSKCDVLGHSKCNRV